MAQPCSIQDKEKAKQLKEVRKSDFKREIDRDWKKYVTLCELDNVTPKHLLTDTSYYDHVDEIDGEQVLRAIAKAITELCERAIKEEEQDPQKRDARRIGSNGVKCNNCNSFKVMNLSTYSRNESYVRFPSGIENDDGYFPSIPYLCGGNTLNMNLCLDCGILVGFDKKKFNLAVTKVEYTDDVFFAN